MTGKVNGTSPVPEIQRFSLYPAVESKISLCRKEETGGGRKLTVEGKRFNLRKQGQEVQLHHDVEKGLVTLHCERRELRQQPKEGAELVLKTFFRLCIPAPLPALRTEFDGEGGEDRAKAFVILELPLEDGEAVRSFDDDFRPEKPAVEREESLAEGTGRSTEFEDDLGELNEQVEETAASRVGLGEMRR